MSDPIHTLRHTINGRSVFRRDHTKNDGRALRLYGYDAHTSEPFNFAPSDIAKGGELRWHPLRKEWNIYAPHRQNRTFKPVAADDPLAPVQPGGPETEIPFEDFELAIFDNKFTSLHPDAPVPPTHDFIKTKRADGQCDVIVYGTKSHGNLHSLGQDKRRLLLAAWIDRYEMLFHQDMKFVLPFENRGDAVGVTLPHPHGQIYAFPFVPDVQQKAVEAFEAGYDLCRVTRDINHEYVVNDAGGIKAICPPFARFPFEVWLIPTRRVAGPWNFTNTEADGFAYLLGEITRKYDAHFQTDTPYMLNLQASPKGAEAKFHFTAQFFPLLRAPGRVKYLASVEQSTGVFTVDVMPEAAAKLLKDL